MQTIKWGILSTSKIGVAKVIPAMQQSEVCDIIAIASRNIETASAAANQLKIKKAYGSYEDLLADDEIDAIYNPLPNHLHVLWSIKALKAGKHVLCEKPIGLSSVEAEQLVEVGKQQPQLKLMEAFMYRHHPQWQKTREMVHAGDIGELVTIQSLFSYFNDDEKNFRNISEYGGGGLMDIGCYPISLSRFIFESEPIRVMGIVEFDPTFNVDRLASAILDFGSGTSTLTCSTQMAPYQRVNIFGKTGRIEIEIPFNAPPDKPCNIWHQLENESIEQLTFDICNQYTIQGDLFSQAILNNTPVPTPIADAVLNMKVIEAIFESAESGSWVDF